MKQGHMHRFQDRIEAGQLLARHIENSQFPQPELVVALPRGGVIVGAEIARRLHLPLEILLVRKLGAPSQPELAIGAIASGGFIYLNQTLIERLGVTSEEIATLRKREERELERREFHYRNTRAKLSLAERHLVLVDDGIATGATIEVAIRAIKAARPASLAVATPVAALPAIERLHRLVDHVHALQIPNELGAIGDLYREFSQVSDEQVIQALDSIKKGISVHDR